MEFKYTNARTVIKDFEEKEELKITKIFGMNMFFINKQYEN